MGLSNSTEIVNQLTRIEQTLANLKVKVRTIEKNAESMHAMLSELQNRVQDSAAVREQAEAEMAALQRRNTRLASKLRRIDAIA